MANNWNERFELPTIDIKEEIILDGDITIKEEITDDWNKFLQLEECENYEVDEHQTDDIDRNIRCHFTSGITVKVNPITVPQSLELDTIGNIDMLDVNQPDIPLLVVQDEKLNPLHCDVGKEDSESDDESIQSSFDTDEYSSKDDSSDPTYVPESYTKLKKRNSKPNYLLVRKPQTNHDQKLLLCDICANTYCDKQSLRRHMAVIHNLGSKEEKLKCTMCSMKMYSRHLKNHMRTHSPGSSCSECYICLKKFRSTNGYRYHLLTHEIKSGEQPDMFKCKYCSLCYTKKQILREHMRIHTKEKITKCSTCKKEFINITRLKTHIRAVHDNDKSHRCSTCLRGFPEKWKLKRHETIHTKSGITLESRISHNIDVSN